MARERLVRTEALMKTAQHQYQQKKTALETAQHKLKQTSADLQRTEEELHQAEAARASTLQELRESENTAVSTRESLVRVTTERDTAQQRLEEAQRQLDKVQNPLITSQISISQARNLFQQAQCIGNDVCVELVCFPLYQTCEEALGSVDRLKSNIQLLSEKLGPVPWIQSALAQLATRVPSLAPLSEQNLVYAGIVECYAALVPAIRQSGNSKDAIDHCLRWLRSANSIRLEAATLLVPQLLEFPERDELLDTCRQMLTAWGATRTRDDRLTLCAILHSLEKCGKAAPNRVRQLLDIAFDMAVGDWNTYGDEWRFIIRNALGHYLQADDKDGLAHRISSHVALHGAKLIAQEDRRLEYEGLVHVLTEIRGREQRPRNRYVVRDQHPIPVEVTVGVLPPARGSLVNFSLETGRWTPGAFVRLASKPTLDASNDWRSATVHIHWREFVIEIERSEVLGPEPERGGTYGLRVRFPSISTDAIVHLQQIASDNPVKR